MNPNRQAPTATDAGLAQSREAAERQRAKREIDSIARDLARPAEEIAEVYNVLYADMKAHARVPDYVRVFTARKVRARYQHGSPDKH